MKTAADIVGRARQVPGGSKIGRRVAPLEWILLTSVGALLAVSVAATGLHQLSYIFAYAFVSNTLVALVPHEPGMIYFGKFYPPVLVAAVAALGTAVAAFVDYHALGRILRSSRLQRLYRKPFYGKARRYFRHYPMLTLAMAGFLPLPYSPFKFMAITSGYTELEYIAAVLLGRTPRYYLLALVGKAWNLPNEAILGLFLFIVAIAGISGVRQLWNNRNGKRSSSQIRQEDPAQGGQ